MIMKKKILIIVLSVIIVFVVGFCFLFNINDLSLIQKENNTYTVINQSSKTLGNVERKLPQVSNEGLNRYPVYGTELSDCELEEKHAILEENRLLNAQEGFYDSMDKDGNLYLNGESINRKLYKHTASIGMYYGDVSDSEKAVIKQITINPSRLQGNYITGLYAPAGEVIKIEIDDINLVGQFEVHIGQVSQLGNINNIWDQKGFNRMPVIVNKMVVNSNEAYVGSYLGGPIYINTPKILKEFTVTIIGAVEYPTFILGQTTQSEYEKAKNTSAPYFDLEVWDKSVRHSGPKKEIVDLSFDNLTKSARLWDKFNNISRQIPNSANANVGITFLYDPFICAGAAVAIVGQSWCNLPPSWMKGSLTYETFINEGMWGTIHEFNHHFQRYGISPGDEVTNNAINILSYISYTNISASRSVNNPLTGWNRYLDPQISLNETITNQKNDITTNSLSLYTDVIHTFGVDLFIKACKYQNRAGGIDNWFKSLCYTMKYDFTYYFEQILKQTLSTEIKSEIASLNYPMFIPVASTYQVGRSYLANNEIAYSNTVKPYEILAQEEFVLDFEKNIAVPEGFTYKIVDISNPTSGSLERIDDLHYIYLPGKQQSSGDIDVKVLVSNGDISQEIILKLNLKQNYELIKVTSYTYDNLPYKHINEAIESNLEGYSSKTSYGVKNQVVSGLKKDSITLVEGKYLIKESGEYQITYRGGRGSSVLYVSVNDEKKYSKFGYIDINQSLFEINGMCNTKISLEKGDVIYFKELLLATSDNARLELGYSLTDDVADMVSVNNVIGINGSFDKHYFWVDDFYPREYSISEYKYQTNISIVDYQNYTPWDDNYLIDNMLDGNPNTVGHSLNMINSENPFSATFKLDSPVTANQIIITGHTRTDQLHLPYKFDLFVGLDETNMKLVKSYDGIDPVGRNIYIDFEQEEFAYFKIIVYDTNTHRYLAISNIQISYQIEGTLMGPDYLDYFGYFRYRNDVISTFGHIYEGKGRIEFGFVGERFMLISTYTDNSKLKITIDGKSEEIIINESNGINVSYISKLLADDKHNCVIEVLEGDFNIDSIVLG